MQKKKKQDTKNYKENILFWRPCTTENAMNYLNFKDRPHTMRILKNLVLPARPYKLWSKGQKSQEFRLINIFIITSKMCTLRNYKAKSTSYKRSSTTKNTLSRRWRQLKHLGIISNQKNKYFRHYLCPKRKVMMPSLFTTYSKKTKKTVWMKKMKPFWIRSAVAPKK